MPHLFGRKYARSSESPVFTWEPEGRRGHGAGRFVALGALALAAAGLTYGAAHVAGYLGSPGPAAIATSQDGSAATGSSSADRDATAKPAEEGAGPLATGSVGSPAASSAGADGEPARSEPPKGSADAVTSTPRAKSPSNEPAVAKPPSRVTVLNSGVPGGEGEAKGSAAEASPPRERTLATARRERLSNLRQRKERRLSLRERRKREPLEAELPWRFAPTIQADLDAWRREGLDAPYGPRFYRDRD
jgi:hypothetical protein